MYSLHLINNTLQSLSDPQLHFLPGLFVQVDGVQLGPAHGLHVGLVSLPEVDHLKDRDRVRADTDRDMCMSALQDLQGQYIYTQSSTILSTDLIAHLGNKGRLPGNEVSDPRGGPELVRHFSVDGWSGLWALIRKRKGMQIWTSSVIFVLKRLKISWHLKTHAWRLVLGFLGLLFAALHWFFRFFLLVALLLLLLFLFFILILLFRGAESAVDSST